MSKQMNFFDLSNHYAKLSSRGDRLERLLKVLEAVPSNAKEREPMGLIFQKSRSNV